MEDEDDEKELTAPDVETLTVSEALLCRRLSRRERAGRLGVHRGGAGWLGVQRAGWSTPFAALPNRAENSALRAHQ